MRNSLDESVSVLAGYSDKNNMFRPLIVTWRGIDYRLGTVDFYHTTKRGATTLHHFSLADKAEQIYFKLLLDGSTLRWTLQEHMSHDERQAHYA